MSPRVPPRGLRTIGNAAYCESWEQFEKGSATTHTSVPLASHLEAKTLLFDTDKDTTTLLQTLTQWQCWIMFLNSELTGDIRTPLRTKGGGVHWHEKVKNSQDHSSTVKAVCHELLEPSKAAN